MRKFLKNILLFVLLMFTIGIVKLIVFQNNNISSTVINSKLAYLKKHPEYDLYFIGSSKIADQVDCRIINQKIPKLKPYNLGANASFNLENFQTLDYILEQQPNKPKYIILELQDKIDVTRQNINSDRSFGVFNFSNLLFANRFHWENKNFKQIVFAFYSHVLNVFHYRKSIDEKNLSEDRFIADLHGFMPLDLTRNAEERTDEKKLKKEIDDRLNSYKNDKANHQPNKAYAEQLNRYAEKCEKKGIKLIFFIPGPAEKDAKKLQVYNEVLTNPIINLANPEITPEFYELENRWDYGHLNLKGAEIMSEKLSEELKKLVVK